MDVVSDSLANGRRIKCLTVANRLVREGVPCDTIRDVATALADTLTQHRGMVVHGPHSCQPSAHAAATRGLT